MKKIISTILICVVLLGCVMSFASCDSILMGEYELDAVVATVTYKFKMTGKVTITYDPIIGDSKSFDGEYSISDDGEEITFTFEDDDAKEYSGTVPFSKGEEDGVDYIKLAGIRYNKVD